MTTTKTNVAAQAGDEQAALATQLATWLAEVARLNDLIVHASGAQAGDEPMDYAEQLRAAVETVCEGWTLPPGARKMLETALWAPRVSPRATADVERDAARYQWLRHGNNDELVLQRGPIAPDYVYLPRNAKLDEMIDAHIATTKPGA